MDRHIQTIFCDDVRHELGGKLSYIGDYSGVLLVPAFPVTLPKLCLVIKVLTPAEKPFARLTLRVLKDNEVLIEGNLDETQLSGTLNATPNTVEENEDRLLMFMSIFVFSPLHLEGPCILRVRAETEEGELKGSGMIIGQAPAEIVQA